MKMTIEELSYELWSAAQCAPNEGIEDAAKRIQDILIETLADLLLQP